MDINKRIELSQRLKDARTYAEYWAARLREAELDLIAYDADESDQDLEQAKALGLLTADPEKVILYRESLKQEEATQEPLPESTPSEDIQEIPNV